MSESHCPICFAELEVRDVAPCFDCGSDPTELDHLAEGKHTYTEVPAFGIPIVVCSFCLVDFSSYDPAFFNRPPRTKLGLGEFVGVRAITNPSRGKDKLCPVCRRRLACLSNSSRRSARVAQMVSRERRKPRGDGCRARAGIHAATPTNSTFSGEPPFS
jgi:hypothetical protein